MAQLLHSIHRTGAQRAGAAEEGSTMSVMFAQATSFALSAAGALAILVGVIDQPQIATSLTGAPAATLVDAATSPAVSPLA
ncbi:hypothetical protein CDQ91_17735 [Sphingopyxis witflariensis]|uniref:Uncharacterized protein n=2 Tax=Sphingopyxis witflariensis TaxID=173675 RepID=A0A246JJ75_9SPHN|nr:hypothetical protein CDQ91_17735 [Sphingopyxis witflariensis]